MNRSEETEKKLNLVGALGIIGLSIGLIMLLGSMAIILLSDRTILGACLLVLSLPILGIGGSTIKLNQEWERTIILRLGKYNRTHSGGIYYRIPFIEQTITRDMRTITLDVKEQQVITKDNISVTIDAVVFMKIIDAAKSIINIENVINAVKQYAQPTLRNVVGQYELDDLLTKRETIAQQVKKIVDEKAADWGVDITIVELQDISLPDDMKRIIAQQAEAEREKRGIIIRSEGELTAAVNLKKAAETIASNPIALELRKLSTISDVSQDNSNTIVFAVPLEVLSNVMSATSGLQVPKPYQQKHVSTTKTSLKEKERCS